MQPSSRKSRETIFFSEKVVLDKLIFYLPGYFCCNIDIEKKCKMIF